MTKKLEVVAAVIWDGERYLAVERPEGKDFAGYLEFPGGKVEPGESLEDALSRELWEELGIRPTGIDFRLEKSHAYPEFTVRLHFFEVSGFEGNPSSREGQGLFWFEPGQENVERFLPADRTILRQLVGDGNGSINREPRVGPLKK